MSIATSANVKPSKRLYMLGWLMCVCLIAVGVLVGLDVGGNFTPFVRIAVAVSNAVFVFLALFHISRKRKSFRIDISGIGQIRLMQYEDKHQECVAPAEKVHLDRASVLWPEMMFLCLKNEHGQTTLVPVLRDSVSTEEFHALSVACRWIAKRSGPQDEMT